MSDPEHSRSDDGRRPSAGPEPDDCPVGEGEYDPLILWMLSLTPTERVEVAQGYLDGDARFQDKLIAGTRHGTDYPSPPPDPVEIIELASASLADVPASDLAVLTRKLEEPER